MVADQLGKQVGMNITCVKSCSQHTQGHIVETALLRVQNDILCALDQRKCVALILLDLSAAFDMLDHLVLLNRLATRIGIYS